MVPICIAGGGIGGLSLAVALQRQGVDVVVLERQAEIRDTGAGISLWPNALAALDSMELGDLVRELGATLASGGQRKLDGRPGLTFESHQFHAALGEGLICVDRGLLVRALAGRLSPGSVRTGCTVTGYRRTPNGVVVEVEGGEPVEAAALVGADGISSAVAAQLGGPFNYRYSGYLAWRAIADTEPEADRGQIWACLARGREFGWLPVGNGRTYWFATAWRCRDEEFPEGDAAYLSRSLSDWPRPVNELLAATPADRLVRNDIVDRSLLPTWCDGPVTVLGDAAHPMRPHLGQGGCQALEDAATLTACLTGITTSAAGSAGVDPAAAGSACVDPAAAGSAGVDPAAAGFAGVDPAAAFRQYERRRRRRAHLIVRLSKHSSFTRPDGPATRVFDFVAERSPSSRVGLGLRALAPIAGYQAGVVTPSS